MSVSPQRRVPDSCLNISSMRVVPVLEEKGNTEGIKNHRLNADNNFHKKI